MLCLSSKLIVMEVTLWLLLGNFLNNKLLTRIKIIFAFGNNQQTIEIVNRHFQDLITRTAMIWFVKI